MVFEQTWDERLQPWCCKVGTPGWDPWGRAAPVVSVWRQQVAGATLSSTGRGPPRPQLLPANPLLFSS